MFSHLTRPLIVTSLTVAALTAANLTDVFPTGTPVEPIGSGYQFIEGPAWNPVDGSWIFSDIPANRLYRIDPAGSITVAVEPSDKANGNWFDPEGRRTSFHHGSRRITRTAADGTVTVLAATVGGKPFNSPNDGAYATDGSLWFTDPAWGLEGRPQEQPVRGVYRLAKDANEPELVIRDLEQPNGICFSPDGGTLYVAESGAAHRVHAYTLRGTTPVDGRIFTVITPGVPDGMRCDVAGRLYVSAGDGVQVFLANGTKLGVIPTPKSAANCAFGDADRKTLMITAVDQVWKVRLAVAGRP